LMEDIKKISRKVETRSTFFLLHFK